MVLAYPDASWSQFEQLAIYPKFIALPSFFASLYLFYDVTRIYRKKPSKFTTYHSILVGMSITDILLSMSLFLSSWPAPRGRLPFAIGNKATCTIQGFLVQIGIGTMSYNAFLSVYFMLIICYKWTDQKLKDCRYRLISHVVSITFAVGTAAIAAGADMIHPEEGYCWIGNRKSACIPEGTPESDIPKEFLGASPCQNDDDWLSNLDNSKFYEYDNTANNRFALFYAPLMAIVLISELAMLKVFVSYVRQIRKTRKWTQRRLSLGNDAEAKRTRLFTTQALLYILSFNLPFIFIMYASLSYILNGNLYFFWVLLSNIFVPSQGCLNLLLYLRPKWIHAAEQRREQEKFAARDQMSFRDFHRNLSSFSMNLDTPSAAFIGKRITPKTEIGASMDQVDEESPSPRKLKCGCAGNFLDAAMGIEETEVPVSENISDESSTDESEEPPLQSESPLHVARKIDTDVDSAPTRDEELVSPPVTVSRMVIPPGFSSSSQNIDSCPSSSSSEKYYDDGEEKDNDSDPDKFYDAKS